MSSGPQLVKKFSSLCWTQGSLPPLPVPILSQINPVHASQSHFLKIYFNNILTSTPRSSKWSLSIRFSHQNPTCMCHLLHVLHPRPFWLFLNMVRSYGEETLALRPPTKREGRPLVCCQRLLMNTVAATPPYWRLFFHPPTDDTPWLHGYTYRGTVFLSRRYIIVKGGHYNTDSSIT